MEVLVRELMDQKEILDPGRVAEGWQPVCAVSDRMREDNLWFMTNAVLVLSMNAAFGLLEAGCVRYKNVLNIMMKNLADLTLGGLVWWTCGYAFAFPSMVKPGSNEKWPFFVFDEAFWFFQWTFASTAATIDSGALAERVNFVPYCLLSVATTGIIYAMVVRMAWDADGYLVKREVPYMDFAGGSVVHLVGGVSALVSAMIIGPRIGRFQDYKPCRHWLAQLICRRSVDYDYYMVPTGSNPVTPITDAVSLIWGVFFLWIGWYGFNTGGVGEIEGAGTYIVGRVSVNTTFGAVGGGCMAVLIDLILYRGKIHAENLAMGILGGLVAITAGCYYFGNGSSFVIGALGDIVAVAAKLVLERFRVDDVVSAFPIHGACGAFGAIAIALWAEDWECAGNTVKGLFFARTAEEVDLAWKLLGTQTLGVVMITVWTASTTFTLVTLMNQVPLLRFRVTRDIELRGVDEVEHRMAHESLDTQLVFTDMLESLASCGTVDEMMPIFANAAACMTIGHKMKDLRDKHTKRKSQTLIVNVLSLEGLSVDGSPPSSGPSVSSMFSRSVSSIDCSWTVTVEIVAAVAPKLDEQHYTRECSYFAPRNSTCVSDTDGKVEWPSEYFTFEDFSVPPGGEDHIFVCFQINYSGKRIAEAYAPIKAKHWNFAEGGNLETCLSLDLVPSGPRASIPPETATLRVKLSLMGHGRLTREIKMQIAETRSERSNNSRPPLLDFGKDSTREDTMPFEGQRVSLAIDRIRNLEQQVAVLTAALVGKNDGLSNSSLNSDETAV